MIKEHTTCMVQQVFMDQKLTKLKVFWTIQEFVRKGSKKQISLLKTNFICFPVTTNQSLNTHNPYSGRMSHKIYTYIHYTVMAEFTGRKAKDIFEENFVFPWLYCSAWFKFKSKEQNFGFGPKQNTKVR